jgi:hypothetical protein
MGTMTRAEILAEVKSNIDQEPDIADATIERYINHTLSHMTHPSVHRFEDLATTYDIALVVGQASYSIAEAAVEYRILRVRSVSFLAAAPGSIVDTTVRRGLDKMSIDEYDRTQHQQTPQPSRYVLGEGQTILIHNTPSVAHTVRLRLYRETSKLTADGSTTELPEFFDQVLVTGAQALTEFSLNQRDKARETFQLYNSFIANVAPKDILESQNWGIETDIERVPSMGISI